MQIGAKKPIQDLLVEMGFIKEEDLMRVSSILFRMPISNLKEESIEPSVIKMIPHEVAKRYGVFPVRIKDNTLILAMSDPVDVVALDNIRSITNIDVKPILCAKSDISTSIEKYYHSEEILYDLLKNVVNDKNVDISKAGKELDSRFDVEAIKGEYGPIIRLINFVLSDSLKSRATDIHIEPQENSARIRYRIDGDLRDIIEVPRQLTSSFVARIKVMANLDLAESKKPQDGRINISTHDRSIDIRVSVIPTYRGEKVVLRLLDPNQAKVQLDRLGFPEVELNLFKETCKRLQGMILVTGPTGSGKTSTLYAALNFIKSAAKNIITIEDPVEYLIDGVNQIQVNRVKNVTFANGLRSILRQDPNVILVGEIRDLETAEIAFRSSLTGHLVFSTLHTNNAIASITRLLDIGLEPYLIASSLILIVAQRLVKLICPHCRMEYTPSKNIIDKCKMYIEKFDIKKFYKGKGCEQCHFTGFLDRTGVFEILNFNEKIRELVVQKASEDLILKEARKNGLNLLVNSGMEKVARGITTLEEVASFAYLVEEPITDTKPIEEAKVPQKREEPLQDTKAHSGESVCKNIKILVVDDEENILNLVESRINSIGYQVIKARNGIEAVELSIKEKPDLIIMDIMMPKMDGLEATKFLKSSLETASIPILLLTAKKDVESEVAGIDVGADDYVGKPFDGKRLLARILMLLRRKNLIERK